MLKALVLAAGYATRLYPLTLDTPKHLLSVGGRPMVDHVLDRLRAVPELDEVHLVTNAKFATLFEQWAPADVTVHDDGTTSEDDRLGAIGDLRFVIDRVGGDDWLVMAGDNLFDFSLADYVSWWRRKGTASAVALYEHPEPSVLDQYGIVEVDESERVVSFVEKPSEPRSNLIATATYLFHRKHLALVPSYLDERNSPDQPGRFVEWLYARAPVYGYRFRGDWFDIGDRGQLLEADNRVRARLGLAERARYSVD